MQGIKYQLRILRNYKFLSVLALFIFPLPIFPSYLAQLSFLLLGLILLIIFIIDTTIKASNIQELREALNLEFYQFKPFIDQLSPEAKEFLLKFEKPIEYDLRALTREQAKIFFCLLFFIYSLHCAPALMSLRADSPSDIYTGIMAIIFGLYGIIAIICWLTTFATFQHNVAHIKYYEKHRKFDANPYKYSTMFALFLPCFIFAYMVFFSSPIISRGYSGNGLLFLLLILLDFFLVLRFAHSARFKQSLEYQYSFLEGAYADKEVFKSLLTNDMTNGTSNNPPPPITPPTFVFNPNQRKPKRPY